MLGVGEGAAWHVSAPGPPFGSRLGSFSGGISVKGAWTPAQLNTGWEEIFPSEVITSHLMTFGAVSLGGEEVINPFLRHVIAFEAWGGI